jgi:phosphate transport system permease protein
MTRTGGDNPKDLLFEKTTAFFAFGVLFLAVLLFALLVRESIPAIRKFGGAFLVTKTWDPVAENFGALTFAYGTIV